MFTIIHHLSASVTDVYFGMLYLYYFMLSLSHFISIETLSHRASGIKQLASRCRVLCRTEDGQIAENSGGRGRSRQEDSWDIWREEEGNILCLTLERSATLIVHPVF